MSVIVTAIPGQPMLSASQTHADGSTSTVPGSPFVVAEVPQRLMALGPYLLVKGESSISVFDVDRETGALKQTELLPAPLLRDIVANPVDSTVFLLDENAVSGFRLENGRLIALPGSPFPVLLEGARQQIPKALALSGDSLFVAFPANAGGAPDSFAVLKRAPDGSLSGFSPITEVPEEVQRAISGSDSPSGTRGRIAAVINLQASN
jgi:hypothetical protein